MGQTGHILYTNACLCTLNEDFIQGVQRLLRWTASIVLFTQNQIDDIRLLLCSRVPAHLRSVLVLNTTFNVSSMYVWLTVFKHCKVLHRKFSTYLHFFSKICGAPNGDCINAAKLRVQDCMLTGSDEETALVNALRTALAGSKQLYCCYCITCGNIWPQQECQRLCENMLCRCCWVVLALQMPVINNSSWVTELSSQCSTRDSRMSLPSTTYSVVRFQRSLTTADTRGLIIGWQVLRRSFQTSRSRLGLAETLVRSRSRLGLKIKCLGLVHC